MRNHFLLFVAISMFLGCSRSYNEKNQTSIPPKKYPIVEKIDSSNFIATIKPIDYKMNEESNPSNVNKQEDSSFENESKYPNPSSPESQLKFHIQKADSLKFFMCNENESYCYKFQEGYFEQGNYILIFNKMNIEGALIFKIEMPDTIISRKFICVR